MKRFVFALAFCLLPALAAAQACPAEVPVGTIVVGANGVCFPASVDHFLNDVITGLPRVTSYDLCFFDSTIDSNDLSKAAVQCFTLGKPVPNPNNNIQVTNATYFGGWPLTGTLYKAVLITKGPSGSSRSAGSHGFFGLSNPNPPAAVTGLVLTHP